MNTADPAFKSIDNSLTPSPFDVDNWIANRINYLVQIKSRENRFEDGEGYSKFSDMSYYEKIDTIVYLLNTWCGHIQTYFLTNNIPEDVQLSESYMEKTVNYIIAKLMMDYGVGRMHILQAVRNIVSRFADDSIDNIDNWFRLLGQHYFQSIESLVEIKLDQDEPNSTDSTSALEA